MKFWLLLSILFVVDVGAVELQFSEIPQKNNGPESFIRHIQRDEKGFVWIAAHKEVVRFDGYQYKRIETLFSFPPAYQQVKHISAFQIASDGTFLILTKNQGLFVVKDEQVSHISADGLTPPSGLSEPYALLADHPSSFWIADRQGLLRLNLQRPEEHSYHPFPQGQQLVKTLLRMDDLIYVASKESLLRFDPGQDRFAAVDFHGLPVAPFIWDMHADQENRLWLSTDAGVYVREGENGGWNTFLPEKLTYIVKSIASDDEDLWFGTAINGLVRVSKDGREYQHYRAKEGFQRSLTSNDITRVYTIPGGTLWIAFFDGSVSYASLTNRRFGLNRGLSENARCFTSRVIYDFHEDRDKHLWVVTQNEVIRMNPDLSNCNRVDLGDDPTVFPISLTTDHKSTVWVSSNKGLHSLVIGDSGPELETILLKDRLITFLAQVQEDALIVGTTTGLLRFDLQEKSFSAIPTDASELEQARFTGYALAEHGAWFSTDVGLVRLINGKLQRHLPSLNLSAVLADGLGQLWLAVEEEGVFRLDPEKSEHSLVLDLSQFQSRLQIRSMVQDHQRNFWFGTDSGLLRYDQPTGVSQLFRETDGLQSDEFTVRSALVRSNGMVFLGGRNGLNAFYPSAIHPNQNTSPLVLTDLKRFNKTIQPKTDYSGFSIDQNIDALPELTLTYQDLVIDLEFALLDYVNPQRHRYAYRLAGFDPDWNDVDASDRKATYTDLPAGQYEFSVKAANAQGVWSDSQKTMQIRVLPAPWLSWWAILGYVLIGLSLIFWIISRKTRASQKIADLLRVEVEEKTAELKVQKQTVESLLAKKNTLFSNVSHEFRTPLTVILGMINQLLQQARIQSDAESLGIIKRNANRLLTLVEQLLQLATTADVENNAFVVQATAPQVASIVASFEHMASVKRIDLRLTSNEAATINASSQCLDAILGNLISNAIKYTPNSGQVEVNAKRVADRWVLQVKDNGGGIEDSLKEEVFERFRRLDAHAGVEGIGIGLAVVKEVVELNHGTIQLDSDYGSGCHFTIDLPISNEPVTAQPVEKQSGLLEQLSQPAKLAQSGCEDSGKEPFKLADDDKPTVLIIEDNADMQQYILGVLSAEYHCLQATDGRSGVAKAIQYVPDLIVCDVMMPVMDGFKVARVIRSDQRTCHIPLVLLTALNDRSNKIRGWREQVDAYMTKPFDQEELLTLIENSIAVRNLLRQQVRKAIKHKPKAAHHHLPKKDQDFINKLMQVFERHYQDASLRRTLIADKMAVSDRQLQRKVKALVGQNPTDMLREFRLKKAAELLKQGYQVSQVCDESGFVAVSHFSQCFKATFGMTPSEYQKSCRASDPESTEGSIV